MKIGNFIIRKPFGRYVAVDFEDEVYFAIRRSILEDLLRETDEKIKELDALQ